MKKFTLQILLTLLPLFVYGQNVIVGANTFMQSHPLTEIPDYNFSSRMGVDVYNLEIGLKSFFAEEKKLQAYGISLYSIIPFQKIKKFAFFGQVEGGFSFVYDESFGSERAFQIGLSPGLAFQLRDYFNLEVRLGYFVFANITVETPQLNQLFLPSIGWSVRI